MEIEDFKVKRFIGSGPNSLVYEVEFKGVSGSEKKYALKRTCLRSRQIIKRILQERKVLEMITNDERTKNSSFLPTLYAAFLLRKSAVFVLPAGSGIDLHQLWNKYCPFRENEVRFYAAEILCGLEALHTLKIVHVDLKVGNVIIMPSGHIKLIDFDNSLDISSGASCHTDLFAGTALYRPPELVFGNLINEKADIWCWAMIIVALLCISKQMKNQALMEVRSNTVNFDHFCRCSSELKNLLLKCFEKNPDDRPYLNTIKRHSFFKYLQWEDVESCKLEPPRRLNVFFCAQHPKSYDQLVLKNLTETEMIDVHMPINNSRGIIRYGRLKQDASRYFITEEIEKGLANFEFVQSDEFEIKQGEKGDEEDEKTETLSKCCLH